MPRVCCDRRVPGRHWWMPRAPMWSSSGPDFRIRSSGSSSNRRATQISSNLGCNYTSSSRGDKWQLCASQTKECTPTEDPGALRLTTRSIIGSAPTGTCSSRGDESLSSSRRRTDVNSILDSTPAQSRCSNIQDSTPTRAPIRTCSRLASSRSNQEQQLGTTIR